jgi:hypothetical protein
VSEKDCRCFFFCWKELDVFDERVVLSGTLVVGGVKFFLVVVVSEMDFREPSRLAEGVLM